MTLTKYELHRILDWYATFQNETDEDPLELKLEDENLVDKLNKELLTAPSDMA